MIRLLFMTLIITMSFAYCIRQPKTASVKSEGLFSSALKAKLSKEQSDQLPKLLKSTIKVGYTDRYKKDRHGSGVLLGKKGYFLTSHHVMKDCLERLFPSDLSKKFGTHTLLGEGKGLLCPDYKAFVPTLIQTDGEKLVTEQLKTVKIYIVSTPSYLMSEWIQNPIYRDDFCLARIEPSGLEGLTWENDIRVNTDIAEQESLMMLGYPGATFRNDQQALLTDYVAKRYYQLIQIKLSNTFQSYCANQLKELVVDKSYFKDSLSYLNSQTENRTLIEKVMTNVNESLVEITKRETIYQSCVEKDLNDLIDKELLNIQQMYQLSVSSPASVAYNDSTGNNIRISVGQVTKLADHTFRSDLDSTGGSSGSGIYDLNGKLVGLHFLGNEYSPYHYMVNPEINNMTPIHISMKNIATRLWLADALHDMVFSDKVQVGSSKANSTLPIEEDVEEAELNNPTKSSTIKGCSL